MTGFPACRVWPVGPMSACALLFAAVVANPGVALGEAEDLGPEAEAQQPQSAASRQTVPGLLWSPPEPRPVFLSSLEHHDSLPMLRPPAPRPAFLAVPASVPASAPQRNSRDYVQEPTSTGEIISRAGVSGVTGAILFDLSNGALLDAHARHISLPPASTIKIATGAWALDVLGPQHQFETRVLATGPLVDGWVQGDLVLQGSGDPGLDNRALSKMVDALVDSGIRGVEGKFRYDDTALPRGSRIDIGQRDGTAASTGFGALNLNYNRILLESEVREDDTFDVRLTAHSDEIPVPVSHISVQVVDSGVAGNDGLLRHNATPGGEAWEIDTRSLRDRPARWLPVREPGLYAASVFRTLAHARGLTLPLPDRARTTVAGAKLAVHRGRPLAEVVSGMLDFSNNLVAEILGLSAAAASGAPPLGLRDGARRMARWIGSEFAAYNRLVDHSGLGDQARITPAVFQSILVRGIARAGSSEADIRSILPIRVLELSPTSDLLPPVLVQAKTGTLYYVRGLVGYIRLGDGAARDLGFAIFSADLQRRRRMEVGQYDPAPPPDVTDARRWRKEAVELETAILRNWIQALS